MTFARGLVNKSVISMCEIIPLERGHYLLIGFLRLWCLAA
jgi:hypothetical protein